MTASLFFSDFEDVLDEIAAAGFQFENTLDRLPSTASFSKAQRLNLFRQFDLERTDFVRRVKIDEVMDSHGDRIQLQAVRQAKADLIERIFETPAGGSQLLTEASAALNRMNSESPHFERVAQLRVDLKSSASSSIANAILHLPLATDSFRRAIHLAANETERQKQALTGALGNYQTKKEAVIAQWLSATMLIALNYASGAPVRELAIAGAFGLARAVEKFDNSREFAFGSYASLWIRQAVTKTVVELRGWSVAEIELRASMRRIIGDRWSTWIQSPNPSDVAELGLSDQQVVELIEKMKDTNLYPVSLHGVHLTPECAGVEYEPVELSKYIVTATNPFWFV